MKFLRWFREKAALLLDPLDDARRALVPRAVARSATVASPVAAAAISKTETVAPPVEQCPDLVEADAIGARLVEEIRRAEAWSVGRRGRA
jgi:hypothetical protein